MFTLNGRQSSKMLHCHPQAVRSTHGLEVPLTEKGTNFASPEYLEFLAKTANAKLVENLHRIERYVYAKCYK